MELKLKILGFKLAVTFFAHSFTAKLKKENICLFHLMVCCGLLISMFIERPYLV